MARIAVKLDDDVAREIRSFGAVEIHYLHNLTFS